MAIFGWGARACSKGARFLWESSAFKMCSILTALMERAAIGAHAHKQLLAGHVALLADVDENGNSEARTCARKEKYVSP